jgi:two-component system, LytTR family, response regulator
MNRDFFYLADTAKGALIHPAQITMLESCGNYTRVFTADGKSIAIRRPLRKCLEQLDPDVFFRANRQYVVNLGCVQETRPADAKRLMFHLKNGKEIPLSRTQSLQFRRQFSL